MEISEKTQKFIQDHSKDDINLLRLKYSGKAQKMDIPIEFALLQIEARRKAQKKIPTFLENPLFIFPDTLSTEQASNETVACFHASLLAPGSSVLDLTAGLGIDDLTFAKNGHYVVSCEVDKIKSKALVHNAKILGLDHMLKTVNTNSMDFVRNSRRHFDVVFSDPSRRSESGKRLHALSDCQPDILVAIKDIMRVSDHLLIKSSPLLDLTLIRKTVKDLSHIYIVCLKGECKEVLIDIQKDKFFSGVTVVDMDNNGVISRFQCDLSPITCNSSPVYADRINPADYKYIYEPNAGVMKTGAWKELSDHYPEIRKADANTHLFLSDSPLEGFPGRTSAIVLTLDKKTLKALKGTRCNVVARNHPLTAQEVSNKCSLKPGGDRFIYAFRYRGKPVYVLTEPLMRGLRDQE